MDIYKAKLDINRFHLLSGDMFMVEWNEDYDLDRYAAGISKINIDGSTEYLGFLHEDVAACIGSYKTSEYCKAGDIGHVESIELVTYNELPLKLKYIMTKSSEEACKNYLKSALPIKKRQFVKRDVIKAWVKNNVMELTPYYKDKVNVEAIALKMAKNHNDAEGKRRDILEEGKNSLGNMFPELAKLKFKK